ncbi:MAG: site-specific integrase [Rhodoferax sp.]|nr:site-specific integrase [Rhodoferax sp.]
MSNHLVRRGGIWWARLVVPAKLRKAVGKREFNQSCRTYELAIAKLVASVLLSSWRQQLLRHDDHPVSLDLLKLIDRLPTLATSGYLPLPEAAETTGLSQDQLLREVISGRLNLFCRLSRCAGYVVAIDDLEGEDFDHDEPSMVIPSPNQMPAAARPTVKSGVLPLSDVKQIASALLIDRDQLISVVSLDLPTDRKAIFAPDQVLKLPINKIEVSGIEIEAICDRLTDGISPAAIERAIDLRKAETKRTETTFGKFSHKRFSEAVDAYATAKNGLPKNLVSESEQRQRKKGLLVFVEFMGDLPLSEIDIDTLIAFRDGPLKTLPSKINNLPKELKRDSVKETIAAINAAGVKWPLMSRDMQHERVLWLSRMFSWLCRTAKWINDDPAACFASDSGFTKAERKDLKREVDPHDEGRGPFTDSELLVIFGQKWFATGDGKHIKKPSYWYPFQYWLPLLGLYSGCRIKEASQLHLSDVKLHECGVWYLDINETTKDKSIKTPEYSTRTIPLHPVLIELGFLDYCERLKSEGYQRVFPELTWAKSDAKYAKESGRKMSSMFEDLEMPRDQMHVFHCLRHNMNSNMSRVKMDTLSFVDEDLKKFIRYKVLGHKPGDDINVLHYTHTTMLEKAEVVGGVTYNLPKINKIDLEFAISQIRVALEKKQGVRHGHEDMGPLNVT